MSLQGGHPRLAPANDHGQASPPRRRVDTTWLPWLTFALLSLLAIGLIMRAGRDLFFFGDEWAVLLHRRGLSVADFMRPHNEHVIAVPVLTYKLLLAIFGMDSYTPYRLTVTLFHVGACTRSTPTPGRGSACGSRWSPPRCCCSSARPGRT